MNKQEELGKNKNNSSSLVTEIIGDLFYGIKSYVTDSVDEYTQKKIRMISRKAAFGIAVLVGFIFILIGMVYLINDSLDYKSDALGYLIVGSVTAFIAWITVGQE